MSEYQFYEFQTLDRRLTDQEQSEIRKLSSRVALTPTHAVFTYQFGDFRGDPIQVLARYFDAMLYLANWGTRRLLFRFPRALIPRKRVERYCVEDVITFEDVGEWRVLDFRWDEEGGSDWVEGEGNLSSLVQLREDILRGDYRMLYLGWLKAVELDSLPAEEEEPSIPAGLNTLTPALVSLCDVFHIDPFLLRAAANASPELNPEAHIDWKEAISKLARQECDEYLARVAAGDSQVRLELLSRLQARGDTALPQTPPARTIRDLYAHSANLREVESRARAAERESKRIQELEALSRREEFAWSDVETWIEKYKYREATELLARLNQVAAHKGREAEFRTRLNHLMERYKTRRTWIEGLRNAGLDSHT